MKSLACAARLSLRGFAWRPTTRVRGVPGDAPAHTAACDDREEGKTPPPALSRARKHCRTGNRRSARLVTAVSVLRLQPAARVLLKRTQTHRSFACNTKA